jgi:hypothetical protein
MVIRQWIQIRILSRNTSKTYRKWQQMNLVLLEPA